MSQGSCPDDSHTTATALTVVEHDITSVDIRSNMCLTLAVLYSLSSQNFFFDESRSTGLGT